MSPHCLNFYGVMCEMSGLIFIAFIKSRILSGVKQEHFVVLNHWTAGSGWENI